MTPEYIALTKEQQLYQEDKDCSVKAVALVTGSSYAEAHAVLKKLGRIDGRGCSNNIILLAVRELGKELRPVKVVQEICHKYPGVHANKLRATTHQPARFPKAWKDGKTYMAFTVGHVLAIIDGTVHDWTSANSKIIRNLYEIS